MSEIKWRRAYKHKTSGDVVYVNGVAKSTVSGKPVVIYSSVYNNEEIFASPKDTFLEEYNIINK